MSLTVIILDSVKPSVKGKISSFLFQVDMNIFIGNISRAVRDELWKEVVSNIGTKGSAKMIFPYKNYRRFDITTCGTQRYNIEKYL
jgi:CRISPR-associated protein Cas2